MGRTGTFRKTNTFRKLEIGSSIMSIIRGIISDEPDFRAIKEVVVHPLVLLSIVDHYNRVTKGANVRVVGILLGRFNKKDHSITVSNCYGVPFEEDRKDPSVWFLDRNFVEEMGAMYRKVNSSEHVVGWYSTGQNLNKNDIDIHETIFKHYFPFAVYCLVDVNVMGEDRYPLKCYQSIEEAEDQNNQPVFTFDFVESSIKSLEAEEIGVEHLIRMIRSKNKEQSGSMVQRELEFLRGSKHKRLKSLQTLKDLIFNIIRYLDDMISEVYPKNNQILALLQEVMNLLPQLKAEDIRDGQIHSMNHNFVIIYLNSIWRAILELHNLIDSKLDLKRYEEFEEVDKKEKKKEEKEKKEKEEEEKKKEEKKKKKKEDKMEDE